MIVSSDPLHELSAVRKVAVLKGNPPKVFKGQIQFCAKFPDNGQQTSKPEQDVRAKIVGQEWLRPYTRPSAGTLWTLP